MGEVEIWRFNVVSSEPEAGLLFTTNDGSFSKPSLLNFNYNTKISYSIYYENNTLLDILKSLFNSNHFHFT